MIKKSVTNQTAASLRRYVSISRKGQEFSIILQKTKEKVAKLIH